MRYGVASLLASVLLIGPSSTTAMADVVRLAPNTTGYVVVRSGPSERSKEIGRLYPGHTFQLIDQQHDALWRQVRVPDSADQLGYVSARFTVVELKGDETKDELGSVVLQLPLDPIAVNATDVTEREDFLGIPPDVAPVLVALTSALLVLYAALATNTRNRNDTFRQLRERFETLRGTPGFSEALKTAPDGVGGRELKHHPSWVTAAAPGTESQQGDAVRRAARTQVLEEIEKAFDKKVADDVLSGVMNQLRASAPSPEGEAWKKTIELQESYWVRAFDEWYITTGGRRVRPNHAWRISTWVRRVFGVYRVMWDEYYREAISNTVKDNPMMMVALWHAYRHGHAKMDENFVRDMWDITDSGDRTNAEAAMTKWNELGHSELEQVAKPDFLETKPRRQMTEGHFLLLVFGVVLIGMVLKVGPTANTPYVVLAGLAVASSFLSYFFGGSVAPPGLGKKPSPPPVPAP
jgi:hypothetical protein